METIEVGELHRRANELVLRAEAGETVVVLVGGRGVAKLTSMRSTTWRRWTEAADAFDGPADREWQVDRDRLDRVPADPFER